MKPPLNEILGLEARGVLVHIFALKRSTDSRFHEDLAQLKAPISYVPDQSWLLWDAHRRVAKTSGQRYYQALGYAVSQAGSGLLRRALQGTRVAMNDGVWWNFLQSGYVACEARTHHISRFHAHFANHPTTVACFASMMTGIPYSFTPHARDIYTTGVNHRALAEKIRCARGVVAVSDYNREFLARVANDVPGKLVRIHYGIDLDRFRARDIPPLRPPFIILCVARFVEKKGHAVLIEACARLRSRSVAFQCWLVGGGRLRPRIEALITHHRLTDDVHLLGFQTQHEVLERYRASHLFVLPCVVGSDGDRDGLPVSVLEALACGLPVITTPMTGIPEVVRHRHNGLLVPVGNPDALADAMESVIRDPQLYECLRANTRLSVESQFDIRQTVAQLHRLFEAALS